MKDTELIRLMTDFIVNSYDSGFIKKKAKECIDEVTNRMDSEEEKRGPTAWDQSGLPDGIVSPYHNIEPWQHAPKLAEPEQNAKKPEQSVQKCAKSAQKPEQSVQNDEKPLPRSKDAITEKPSGGGTAEVRHRKAEGAPESWLGSEEDRGRDEVLRGDDLQLHEEGRDQVNAVGR